MAPAADDHSPYRLVGNNPVHGENPGGLEDDPGQQKLFREITERLEDWIWYGRIMHLNVWRMLCRCTVLPAMAMKPTETTGCSLSHLFTGKCGDWKMPKMLDSLASNTHIPQTPD